MYDSSHKHVLLHLQVNNGVVILAILPTSWMQILRLRMYTFSASKSPSINGLFSPILSRARVEYPQYPHFFMIFVATWRIATHLIVALIPGAHVRIATGYAKMPRMARITRPVCSSGTHDMFFWGVCGLYSLIHQLNHLFRHKMRTSFKASDELIQQNSRKHPD